MFPLPGVVLVDNEKRELNQLRDAFYLAGLPCLPLLYSNEPEDETGLDHFTKPENLKVRILFTDLNLKELGRLDAVDLVAPIAAVIRTLVTAGPFILVFWSQHEHEAREVVELLQKRFSNTTPIPFAFETIDKSDFQLTGDPVKDKDMGGRLRAKITEVIKQDSLFQALVDWEYRVAEAARNTVYSLHELAKPEGAEADYTLENHKKSLTQILTVMATESIGKENVKGNPAVAIDQVLLPVLEDQLSQVKERAELDALWTASLPNLGQKVTLESSKQVALLNSFMHIDTTIDGLTSCSRGAFVQIRDVFWADDKLRKHFNKSKSQILNEFLNSAKKVTGKTLEAAHAATIIGFLEISAACDYAQQNVEIPRYVIGALIPFEFEKFTSFGNGDPKHAAIYPFPDIILNNILYKLRLNFRFQVGVSRNSILLGNPLFRVRDQILSDISYKNAQHAARPGIISFT